MTSNAVPAYAVFRGLGRLYSAPVAAWAVDGSPRVVASRGVVPVEYLEGEFIAIITSDTWTPPTEEAMTTLADMYEEVLKEHRRTVPAEPVREVRHVPEEGPKQ